MNRSANRCAAAALFFATGISGLGYQVLWAKLFATGTGHEFPSVLAVVTAFMGGIAAGASLYDRIGALRSYGGLEIVIGAWAAAGAVLFPIVSKQAVRWLAPGMAPWLHWLVVFAAIFLLLLPATVAMGASFPAIQAITAGRSVAFLYSANTAGAMAGALLAAFWLMPTFGIPASILGLAMVNLVCGILALLLFGKTPRQEAQVATTGGLMPAARLFFTGLLGIGLEVVMIRGLNQTLENTVFTFAALLATYLLATAAGAAIFQRFGPFNVQLLLAGLAIACACSGTFLRLVPSFYPWFRNRFGDSLGGVAMAEVAAAGLVLGLPAMCMGATFSALAEQSLKMRRSLSWSVALNTAGAGLAPAVFGLILLPIFGLKGSLLAVALGYVALIGKGKPALALVPVLASAFLLPSGRDLAHLKPGERLAYFREGAMATTSVVEERNGARVLKVNNRFQMGGTAARLAEQRHADIPLLLQGGEGTALFIGLGTGITFETARFYEKVRAEAVELLPEVADASKLFTTGLPGPVHVADGRRFVLASRSDYAVVVADLFHPAQDGTGFLYTLEHFQAVRERLQPGGIFCQWLPLFQLDLATLKTISRTFLAAFPNAEAWLLRFNVDTPVIGLIGVRGDRVLDARVFENQNNPGLAAHLREVGLNDAVRLFGCFVAGPRQLERFSAEAPPNTDAHPIVMFRAPQIAFRQQDVPGERLLAFLAEVKGDAPQLRDAVLKERVAKFIAARDVYLRGLVLEGRGALPPAAAAYIESVRLSSDFTPAYAQALALVNAISSTDGSRAEAWLRQLADAQPDIPVAQRLLERLKR